MRLGIVPVLYQSAHNTPTAPSVAIDIRSKTCTAVMYRVGSCFLGLSDHWNWICFHECSYRPVVSGWEKEKCVSLSLRKCCNEGYDSRLHFIVVYAKAELATHLCINTTAIRRCVVQDFTRHISPCDDFRPIRNSERNAQNSSICLSIEDQFRKLD